jgi:hypothetical protein
VCGWESKGKKKKTKNEKTKNGKTQYSVLRFKPNACVCVSNQLDFFMGSTTRLHTPLRLCSCCAQDVFFFFFFSFLGDRIRTFLELLDSCVLRAMYGLHVKKLVA